MEASILILDEQGQYDKKLSTSLLKLGYVRVFYVKSLEEQDISSIAYFFINISSLRSCTALIETINQINNTASVILLATNADKDAADMALAYGLDEVLYTDCFTEQVLYKTLQYAKKQTGIRAIPQEDHLALFEHNPQALLICDIATSKIIAANEASRDMYGYTRDEFLTLTLNDLRPDDNTTSLRNVLHRSGASKTFTKGDVWRNIKKSGQQFYVRVHSYAISHNGRPAAFITVDDINDEIKKEQKSELQQGLISKQKEQMEYILSSMKEVVWITDPQTFRTIYKNQACEKMYGYTAEEMVADDNLFFSLIHPEDKKHFIAQTEELFRSGSSGCEYRILHKDGSIRYIKDEAYMKVDKDGNPEILTGLSMDITELRVAELELKERVAETEKILDSIADGFFILDKDWCFVYVNKAFERICNSSREEFIGQNYWKKFPKSVNLKWHSEYHRAMRDQVSVHFEEYASSLDRWVSVSAYPKPDTLTVYFTDVTEERKLQEKISYNERNLQALINNTKDMIWSVNAQMKVISANESFKKKIYESTGHTVAIGDNLLMLDYDKEAIRQWEAYYRKALSGKSYKIIDHGLRVEMSFYPIRNREEVIGVSCFCRDITEELKLQEMLAANERNLRALIDNTADFVWSVDTQLKVVTINKTFADFLYETTGLSIHTGDRLTMDNFGEEMRAKWEVNYSRALNGESIIVTDEATIEGKLIVTETSLNPIWDDAHKIIGVSCYARNITEHRRMQEEILLNEHNMRGLINSTQDLIWSVDKTWHIMSANDSYTNWMQKMNGVMLREGDYALPDTFGEKVKKKFISYYQRALTGESFRVTERLKPNKFDIEFIETRYNPIYDEKMNAIGVSCSTRDITETRRYQENIEIKNERLREIAAIQSHEVRGQVATILGLGQLFNYQNFADPINANVLEGFMEATENLDRIIRRIVNKTRIMIDKM